MELESTTSESFNPLPGRLAAAFAHFPPGQLLSGEFTLPDGSHGAVAEQWAREVAQTPLNPATWQELQTIKDRVYEMRTTSGDAFVVKERKTARHRDIPTDDKGVFVPGVSSRKEFEIACRLREGGAQTNEVEVTWEKPVGYIETVEGYELAIFEKSKGSDARTALKAVSAAILVNFDVYKEEFRNTAAAAAQNIKSGAVLLAKGHSMPAARQLSSLSPEEFASAKAHSLLRIGHELSHAQLQRVGYSDQDSSDSFLYEITLDEGRVHVRLVRYDLEYYVEQPPNDPGSLVPAPYTDYSASDIEASAYRHLLTTWS